MTVKRMVQVSHSRTALVGSMCQSAEAASRRFPWTAQRLSSAATATLLKREFLSFKYDAAITTAVNDYLNASSIQSERGGGVSVSIPAATNWLIENYLPKNFSATFPESLLE